MKKLRQVALLGIMLICLCCSAKKIPGQIISKSGDTIDVVIYVRGIMGLNYERMQNGIKYKNMNGQAQYAYPEEIEEVRFLHNGEMIRMLSRTYTTHEWIFKNSGYVFLQLVTDGKMKYFKHYYTTHHVGYMGPNGQMTGGGTTTTITSLLQKGNGELHEIKLLGYKSDICEYLSDCPELVEKILNKDYRKWDMVEIVEFYNENCGMNINLYNQNLNTGILTANEVFSDLKEFNIKNTVFNSYIDSIRIISDISFQIVNDSLQIQESDTSFEMYYDRLEKKLKQLGVKNGNISKRYFSDGSLKEIGFQTLSTNDSGKAVVLNIGVWHQFNKNGKVYCLQSYNIKGEKDGFWTFYDIEGNRVQEFFYSEGKRQEVIKY